MSMGNFLQMCPMRWMSRTIMLSLALTVWVTVAWVPARAQDSKIAEGPPPPPPEESAKPAPPASPAPSSAPVDPASRGPAEPVAPPQPVVDPLGASRSLEVGTFYMKKGDYDAAIDRFQEAAQRQPKLAKPYLLLGEAYEKKNDPASAVTAYRKYLQLFAKAPDQDKINKRIEKLTELQAKHEAARH